MQCPHNEAVECKAKECDRCGWHPDTAKKRAEAKAEREGVCKHNENIECGKHDCAECGWNPEVAEVRKRRNRYGILNNDEPGACI